MSVRRLADYLAILNRYSAYIVLYERGHALRVSAA